MTLPKWLSLAKSMKQSIFRQEFFMQKVVETLTCKDAFLHSFFDFKKAAYSTLEVELDTSFPENLEIVISETAENGRIIHAPGFRTFFQQIVQTGIGHQVIKLNIPYFQAYGEKGYMRHPTDADGEFAPFRYVEVNRHYGDITVRRTVYYPDWDDQASSFASNCEALNTVWDFCKYSIKATTVFECYVDGERERIPYEGDAVITQLGHFCNASDYTVARNTIDWFCGIGRDSWFTDWILSVPRLIQDYIFYSGDQDSLNRWLPKLPEKLLPGCRDKDGLLDSRFYRSQNPGKPDFRDLVDWPKSERDNYESGESNFVSNAMLFRALEITAELTGKECYRKEAGQVRQAIRKRFLKNGLFVDSADSVHTALHTAIFALAFDLAEDAEVEAHKAIIAAKGMACSVYCAQYLLEACFKHGMADHAIKLLTADNDRSWLGMLRDGTTISAESWNERCKPNLDWTHAWGAAPANIVTRCLSGIRPTAPGFAEFVIDPQPGNLEFFKAVQPTPHGSIEIEYSDKKIRFTIPENTRGNFRGQVYEAGTYSLDF